MADYKIVRDFKKYKDRFGLVQPTNDGRTSGNGIRFTAEYLAALFHHGPATLTEQKAILKAISKCKTQTGEYKRAPEDYDHHQEGPDDYVGLGYISYALDPNIAKGIIATASREKWLGIIPKWILNNVNPGKFTRSAWFGRQPQVVAHFHYAAKMRPSFLAETWWRATMILGAFKNKDDQDAWVLSWYLFKVGKDANWINGKVADFWLDAFKRKVEGGIGRLLGDYFQNPKHPSAKWLWGVYD